LRLAAQLLRCAIVHTPVMYFVYVKIPARTGFAAAQQEQRLHEGLEVALTAQGLGSILGWGQSWASGQTDASSRVAFHRIDVEMTEPGASLAVLRHSLTELEAPPGCELHYTLDETAWQEVLGAQGWAPAEPVSSVTAHRLRQR
jgi:hypothetical protein